MLRSFALIATVLVLTGCTREGDIENGGIVVARSTCPQLGIPAGTGSITLFDPAGSTDASAIDVTAAITNLRAQCYEDASEVVSAATFDVFASRQRAEGARTVILPIFNVAMQGGATVAAKRVGQVRIDFPAGQTRAQASGSATVRVNRASVTLPPDVRDELTRRRRAGDIDAAIDPLTKPEVRDAVARATFEQLVGFQLTDAQLRYNVTR